VVGRRLTRTLRRSEAVVTEPQRSRAGPGEASRAPLELRWVGSAAVAALVLVALTELLAALSDVNYVLTLDGVLAASASLEDFRDARDQVQAFGVASMVVIGLAAVAFLAWFHRAYRNLERLGVGELRFGTGWAIGAWLIPGVNLALPKLIANDIWRASAPGIDRTGRGWRALGVSSLIHAWWLLLVTAAAAAIVATVANEFGNRGVLSTPGDFEGERLAFTIYAIAELAAATAAGAAARVVWAVTRRQRAAIEAERDDAPSSRPAPGSAQPKPARNAAPGPSPWAPAGAGRQGDR
jgi:hypothetical protein